MPIYEYACHRCRMIYQFFIRSIGASRQPACPKCGAADLERLMSSFRARTGSKTRGKNPAGANGEPDGAMGDGTKNSMDGPLDDPFANMTPRQQAAAEREMLKLMSDAEGLNDDDPRQLGHLMERMMKAVGQDDSPELKEAIRRLKAGEAPEKIEEDLGEIFGMGLGEAEDGNSSGADGYGSYGYDSGLYE